MCFSCFIRKKRKLTFNYLSANNNSHHLWILLQVRLCSMLYKGTLTRFNTNNNPAKENVTLILQIQTGKQTQRHEVTFSRWHSLLLVELGLKPSFVWSPTCVALISDPMTRPYLRPYDNTSGKYAVKSLQGTQFKVSWSWFNRKKNYKGQYSFILFLKKFQD